MAKRTRQQPRSYKSKKRSIKFVIATVGVLLLVVGLVSAAVMANMNQDLRQQAAGSYKACAGGVSHGQKSCSGSRSVVVCQDGNYVPSGNCAANETCKAGQCIRVSASPTLSKCTAAGINAVQVPNSHACLQGSETRYECDGGWVNNAGTCEVMTKYRYCQNVRALVPSDTANSTTCIYNETVLGQCNTGYEGKNGQCVPTGTTACTSAITINQKIPNSRACLSGSRLTYECDNGYVNMGGKCEYSYLSECKTWQGLLTSNVAHSTPCIGQRVKMYQCDTGYKNQNNKCVAN